MHTRSLDSRRATLSPRRSVRARFLLWVLVMAALSLTVTGATVIAIESTRIDAAADLALQREYREFAQEAGTGVDPATGAPFDDAARLLLVALQHRVPGPYQTYFTMLDGDPYVFTGGDRPVELENEPEALAAIRAVAPGATVAVRDVATSAGTVRLAVVPVSVAGRETTGSFVVAYAVGLEKQGLLDVARLFLVLGGVSLLLIGLVGWLVTGELVRPLTLLRAATATTNAPDLGTRIPVTGEDEIAELTRNYNAMLDRLRASFAAQRQLVDDVGHELRTPVTIVRGSLEVLDPADPAAVAEVRALLLEETDRMGRLVGDLITLAKTGRPDFLVPELVELEELTHEVFGKARLLGPRRWVLDAVADVPLLADGQRLTQAWLQLAENAVRYSDPGSEIGIGSAVGHGEVRMWVRDRGVGIEEADLDRIFDRFVRGDNRRGVEGTGLGLTIARAIAEAHRGRIEAISTPGSGSTFTLVIPAGGPPAAAPPQSHPVRRKEES